MRQPALAVAIVFAASISGFPLLASTLSLVSAPDTPLFTIVMRVVVGAIALVAVVRCRRIFPVRDLTFVMLFTLFWGAYLLRTLFDAFVLERFNARYTPEIVLVWTALFVLGPSISMFFGFDRRTARAAYRLLCWATVVAAAMLVYQSASIMMTLLERGQNIRFEFERLGPIGVGYLGGTLLVLAAVGFTRALERFSLPSSLFWLCGVCVGLYILLIAGSKGPAAAAMAALLAYWLVPMRTARIVGGVVLAVVLYFGVLRLQAFILDWFGFDVFFRFEDAADGDSESVDSRVFFFESAWSAFLESPLVGRSLFVDGTDGYTHNLTLEAFMATGILGGTAYLGLVALMLRSAFRLLVRSDGFEWLALIGIYYFFAGMTSGAHFTSYPHYVSMVAIVMTDAALRQGALAFDGPPRTRARGAHNWFGLRPRDGWAGAGIELLRRAGPGRSSSGHSDGRRPSNPSRGPRAERRA